MIIYYIHDYYLPSLEAFFKSLGIQYSEEEFSALMRRINAEDTSHLSRFDIVKIFLPEKIGRIPPNLTKVSAQRKINKDCFSSFNDHIIRIEQNAGLKKKLGKKIAKDEPTENDFWKQIKKSRSIFRNKIELYNDDNFHHYLPLDSIRKEIDLRKESLKSLISHRKFDQMEEIKKPFCIFVDYYKQYTNN